MILNDVANLYDRASIIMRSSNIDRHLFFEFRRRYSELGETISKELGFGVLAVRHAVELPLETVLGPRAEENFKELADWLSSKLPGFSAPP